MRWLSGRSRPAPPALPRIDAELCLLGHVVLTECSLCATACPHGAIVQDEDQLGIDETKCTGCGLCPAACPQGAITVSDPLPRAGDSALAACARAQGGEPTIGCIHGLDLIALADLHEDGVRNLIWRSGDCRACPHGRGGALVDTVAVFNRLAESRGLAPLVLVAAGASVPPGLDRSVDPGRRRLLFGGDRRRARRRDRLGAFLRRRAADRTALYPVLPSVDGATCTGCLVCLKACPEQALALTPAGTDSDHLTVNAADCTGCGVCVSACARGALSLAVLAEGVDSLVALGRHTCRACGVTFHAPHGLDGGIDLCQVCAATRRHAKLFHVLK